MRTRYLTIRDSAEVNSYGDNYPDIMTCPINKFVYSDIPLKVIVTSADVLRFDLFCYRHYGSCDFTDLILWLNNLSSFHELYTGLELTLPTSDDINAYYVTNI